VALPIMCIKAAFDDESVRGHDHMTAAATMTPDLSPIEATEIIEGLLDPLELPEDRSTARAEKRHLPYRPDVEKLAQKVSAGIKIETSATPIFVTPLDPATLSLSYSSRQIRFAKAKHIASDFIEKSLAHCPDRGGGNGACPSPIACEAWNAIPEGDRHALAGALLLMPSSELGVWKARMHNDISGIASIYEVPVEVAALRLDYSGLV
jgi:hypothetical protein